MWRQLISDKPLFLTREQGDFFVVRLSKSQSPELVYHLNARQAEAIQKKLSDATKSLEQPWPQKIAPQLNSVIHKLRAQKRAFAPLKAFHPTPLLKDHFVPRWDQSRVAEEALFDDKRFSARFVWKDQIFKQVFLPDEFNARDFFNFLSRFPKDNPEIKLTPTASKILERISRGTEWLALNSIGSEFLLYTPANGWQKITLAREEYGSGAVTEQVRLIAGMDFGDAANIAGQKNLQILPIPDWAYGHVYGEEHGLRSEIVTEILLNDPSQWFPLTDANHDYVFKHANAGWIYVSLDKDPAKAKLTAIKSLHLIDGWRAVHLLKTVTLPNDDDGARIIPSDVKGVLESTIATELSEAKTLQQLHVDANLEKEKDRLYFPYVPPLQRYAAETERYGFFDRANFYDIRYNLRTKTVVSAAKMSLSDFNRLRSIRQVREFQDYATLLHVEGLGLLRTSSLTGFHPNICDQVRAMEKNLTVSRGTRSPSN